MTSQAAPSPKTAGIGTVVPAMTRRDAVRYGIALFIGGVLWVAPFAGAVSMLIPATLAEADESTKTSMLGLLTFTGGVVALVANILFGGLSDRTRSRWGKRGPWLIFGGVAAGILFCGMSTARTGMEILPWYLAYQFALNAIVASMIATIPDRSPARLRGTFSSAYGLGMAVAGTTSQVVASRFVENTSLGFLIFGVVTVFSGITFFVISPDRPNRDAPKRTLAARDLFESFSFPTQNARNFYVALTGKFFMTAAAAAVSLSQLYLFTDYIGLSLREAANVIALLSVLGLVLGLVFGGLAGPISDRVGRRKPFVVGAAIIVAIGSFVPFVAPALWAMIVALIIKGTGGAIFGSVDQALNIEVLPDPRRAAKDLGVSNVATTAGQAIGPAITAAVVAISGGSYQWLFPVTFTLSLIGAGLFMLLRGVR